VNSHNWTNGIAGYVANRAAMAGMELWYMNASYAATETLTFGLAAGVGYGEEEWNGNQRS
jgi:hypothetical protein